MAIVRGVCALLCAVALLMGVGGCRSEPQLIGSPALHFFEGRVGSELAQFIYVGPGTVTTGRAVLSETTNFRITRENCNGASLRNQGLCEVVIEHINTTRTFATVTVRTERGLTGIIGLQG
jgi:hypothetical protein